MSSILGFDFVYIFCLFFTKKNGVFVDEMILVPKMIIMNVCLFMVFAICRPIFSNCLANAH